MCALVLAVCQARLDASMMRTETKLALEVHDDDDDDG
jgi:hypothetical protein